MSRAILASAGLGALVALIVMMLLFGLRSDISELGNWLFVAAKFVFAGATTAVALAYLVRIARPSGERRVSAALIACRLPRP